MQNNHVFRVATAAGTTEHIFVADLWQTAPDGTKAHDLQYWAPLRFNDSATPARCCRGREPASVATPVCENLPMAG